MILFSSTENLVAGNEVNQSDGYGVYLQTSSDNNTLAFNWVSSRNGEGIVLHDSRNNSIISNDISFCNRGVRLTISRDNWVYHNNFLDNVVQGSDDSVENHWDYGYPRGGNYWSDYEGEDHYSGVNQDETGCDHVGDVAYTIDGNQDSYPLMKPLPRTIHELKARVLEFKYDGQIDNRGITNSLLVKLNVADKLVEKGKTIQANAILEDAFEQQVENLSGIRISPEAADILIESARYVVLHL